jgi:hypothetical protein
MSIGIYWKEQAKPNLKIDLVAKLTRQPESNIDASGSRTNTENLQRPPSTIKYGVLFHTIGGAVRIMKAVRR